MGLAGTLFMRGGRVDDSVRSIAQYRATRLWPASYSHTPRAGIGRGKLLCVRVSANALFLAVCGAQARGAASVLETLRVLYLNGDIPLNIEKFVFVDCAN